MTNSSVHSGSRAAFQQAGIRIEKLEQFEQLQSALRRIFAPRNAESLLRLLQRKGIPIRDFDRVLRDRVLEASDADLTKSGKGAQQLYGELSLSDQAQIRELYLTALEEIEIPLRAKYNKLYRYY
jgi:hypothetical protein